MKKGNQEDLQGVGKHLQLGRIGLLGLGCVLQELVFCIGKILLQLQDQIVYLGLLIEIELEGGGFQLGKEGAFCAKAHHQHPEAMILH